jgi:hypothetical protein
MLEDTVVAELEATIPIPLGQPADVALSGQLTQCVENSRLGLKPGLEVGPVGIQYLPPNQFRR